MNTQFNYATFVDMFLDSNEDHEPYGVSTFPPRPGNPTEGERDDLPISPPS